ncbi:hypothetical protein PV04_05812 [Phialophora macrospora]|uniref:Uncharacterized protein n=1 Tax=Phialophora macrospora TaxID=1851006 RepID=A0A0D2G330_9EURO|nr:hypothetical protein PV04_05812 [Phialophora macrospora]
MDALARADLLLRKPEEKEGMSMLRLPHVRVAVNKVPPDSRQDGLHDDLLSFYSITTIECGSRQGSRCHDGLNAIIAEVASALQRKVRQFHLGRLEIFGSPHVLFQLILQHRPGQIIPGRESRLGRLGKAYLHVDHNLRQSGNVMWRAAWPG